MENGGNDIQGEQGTQVASAGSSIAMRIDRNRFGGQQQQPSGIKEQENNGAGTGKVDEESEIDFTPEQKKAFFKKLNIEYKGDEDFDEVKNKISGAAYKPAPTIEETPEQKLAKENAIEKRMLDTLIKRGGTIEQYASIKALANADLEKLSKSQAVAELVEAGFAENEAKDMVKERYYQHELDNIEQDEEETKEDFEIRKANLKKRNDFFTKKLNTKGLFNQNNAKETLNTLRQIIAEEDLAVEKENEYGAKASNHVLSMPRQINIELGKLNNKDLGSVAEDVPETVITKVAELFKNPEARKQFFYNADGNLNYEKLAEVFVKAEMVDNIGRTSFLAGEDKATKLVRTTFPYNDFRAVGVGGAPDRKDEHSKEVASFGKSRKAV